MVQKEVSDLLQGRVLVGHALHNDLKVCTYTHTILWNITNMCVCVCVCVCVYLCVCMHACDQ